MWGLTLKKAECRRMNAFKLWCWRRLLRASWIARSNQPILKINPEFSLKVLMLKLKLQYFGHLMWRASKLEKTLMLAKIEGKMRRRVREDEVVRYYQWLNSHESEQTPGESGRQRSLVCWVYGVAKSQTWLSNSTTTTNNEFHNRI